MNKLTSNQKVRNMKNYCKKCGSKSFHMEVKGCNTGLYCNECGAWKSGLIKMK